MSADRSETKGRKKADNEQDTERLLLEKRASVMSGITSMSNHTTRTGLFLGLIKNTVFFL